MCKQNGPATKEHTNKIAQPIIGQRTLKSMTNEILCRGLVV